MRVAYRVVLAFHVALGTVALVAFWVAMAVRNGSRLAPGLRRRLGID